MGLTEATQYVIDKVELGQIAVEDRNIEVVRLMGVRVVLGSIPRDVRKELNAGVTVGKIGRLAQDGLMPECYFHPNAKPEAIRIRQQYFRDGIAALQAVCTYD